jgi:hypothetical protein
MKQATAMHAVPSTTHSCALILVGHQLLSHIDAITRQHAATTKARIWFRKPCGPTALAISVNGIVPIAKMTTATTRQVVTRIPRAARKAVSQ